MNKEFFPDGTVISNWFYDASIPDIDDFENKYVITDYGVKDDGSIQTEKLQALIDKVSAGGGVIVVPKGVFLTGALFFKQGVDLYIEDGGVLLGSDDISDYPVCDTRIEGQSCKYFSALINVDGVDGFKMWGRGTIDGNGLRSWKAFWLRRQWNPDCTNKDEQRPRLVYISNCTNVLVAQLNLKNSHFWTNHIYKSAYVKYIGCNIFSPRSPVPSPSADGIDIDVCHDVLIKDCNIEVNDDGIVLKGGKGADADKRPENGSNERVIIEDCTYDFCHSCLTCGSESIHNCNVIFRRSKVMDAMNLVWFKLRPDTPQKYEYILVEDINGKAENFVTALPWTQFFELGDGECVPLSYVDNITVRNCDFECDTYLNIRPDESQYILSNFKFEHLNVKSKKYMLCDECADIVTKCSV